MSTHRVTLVAQCSSTDSLLVKEEASIHFAAFPWLISPCSNLLASSLKLKAHTHIQMTYLAQSKRDFKYLHDNTEWDQWSRDWCYNITFLINRKIGMSSYAYGIREVHWSRIKETSEFNILTLVKQAPMYLQTCEFFCKYTFFEPSSWIHPWNLGSKYLKYKLKPLFTDKFWAHRAVCLLVTNWFASGTLLLLGLHSYSFIHLKPSDILLTYSMVQSPSWAASQEVPRISRNQNVHYRTHKRSPSVSILGQPNSVHIPTYNLLEIHPNVIHPSTLRSPHWSFSLRFLRQDPIHPPLLTR